MRKKNCLIPLNTLFFISNYFLIINPKIGVTNSQLSLL